MITSNILQIQIQTFGSYIHKMDQRKKQNNSYSLNTGRSSNHPSQQSVYQPIKPTIKVGYNVVVPQQKSRRTKKFVQPPTHDVKNKQSKKHISNKQYASGVFQNSEYFGRQSKSSGIQHQKRAIEQAYQKYYESKQVKNNLLEQFSRKRNRSETNTNSRSTLITESSKSILPSYKHEGIKDILQYQHAGKYRETSITEKCTKANVRERNYNFNQLHEYDFRKKPEFLR